MTRMREKNTYRNQNEYNLETYWIKERKNLLKKKDTSKGSIQLCRDLFEAYKDGTR